MGLGMGVVVGGGDSGVEEMVGSHNHPFSRHASSRLKTYIFTISYPPETS